MGSQMLSVAKHDNAGSGRYSSLSALQIGCPPVFLTPGFIVYSIDGRTCNGTRSTHCFWEVQSCSKKNVS